MDEWIHDGWIDGWIVDDDGWMDGWMMDGWLGRYLDGWMDGRMCGWMDEDG